MTGVRRPGRRRVSRAAEPSLWSGPDSAAHPAAARPQGGVHRDCGAAVEAAGNGPAQARFCGCRGVRGAVRGAFWGGSPAGCAEFCANPAMRPVPARLRERSFSLRCPAPGQTAGSRRASLPSRGRRVPVPSGPPQNAGARPPVTPKAITAPTGAGAVPGRRACRALPLRSPGGRPCRSPTPLPKIRGKRLNCVPVECTRGSVAQPGSASDF